MTQPPAPMTARHSGERCTANRMARRCGSCAADTTAGGCTADGTAATTTSVTQRTFSRFLSFFSPISGYVFVASTLLYIFVAFVCLVAPRAQIDAVPDTAERKYRGQAAVLPLSLVQPDATTDTGTHLHTYTHTYFSALLLTCLSLLCVRSALCSVPRPAHCRGGSSRRRQEACKGTRSEAAAKGNTRAAHAGTG